VRLAAAPWAAMIGSAFFVATFTLEGWLRPGYDAREMYISELALGPRGPIQAANFMIGGALVLLFAWGIAPALRDGKASRAGPVLLALVGLCLLLSGFFVMDPVTSTTYRTAPPMGQVSLHAKVHGILGALFFTLAPVSCFVLLRRFRAEPRWRSMVAWTIGAGALLVVAILLLRVGPARPPSAPNVLNAWCGALQRVAAVTFFAWLFRFGWVLRRTRQSMPNM
jgi:hypothetical protein